jgi:hypothetical protein
MLPKTSIVKSGVCLAFCLALYLPVPAFAAKERMEETTTDRADLPAGGLIHMEKSFGDLNIEAWDQPSVQITATRFTFREDTPGAKEKVAKQLKRIQVVKTVASNGDLTITTSGKHALGIDMEYQIMVPRTARLAIHHGSGEVIVLDVSGDIEATAHVGDILVQLPQPEHEIIHARSRLGATYSDFKSRGTHYWAGSKLVEDAPAADPKAPSQHLDLRVAAGGITILKRNPVAEGISTPAGI